MFDSATEDKLVSAIKELSQRGFPLGMKEVRQLAYSYMLDFLRRLQDTIGFYSFLKRHPDIGIRKPEPLSTARAMGMHQTVVTKWFDELVASVDKLGIRRMPNHFWNADETGLQDHFAPHQVVGK